ncbi:CDP-alcohol phosphatidyltransferase-domain containing protein [Nitzschia inconspicua]|uniref:CDP-alcohol phosphatidyltransferase-domain containing protein n=1 Tax=Nitzschia inconspicua TaxID=303405 RepID=A0A9K3Q8S6_9STRA|nr:CDP-alcohol phosphatidyltransferase-domain containing protein [Nitzschia inconspicua]
MMRHLMALSLAVPSIASSFLASSSFVQQRQLDTPSFKNLRPTVFAIPTGGSSSESKNSPPLDEDSAIVDPPVAASPVFESAVPPPPPPPLVDDKDTTTTATASSMMGPNAATPGALRRTFANLPWHRLPNILTYMRCLAIPALVALFYLPNQGHGNSIACGILFGFASFTDWLDGYLARRWDITSPFGAFLDPVADKLMVSTSLILLAGRYGKVVAIPSLIILAREIAVSALREWMAQRGERDVVKVGMQGKVKTALTMLALTLLLFVPASEVAGPKFLTALYQPSLIMLYLCAVVTVTSGSVYFKAAGPALLGK